MNHVHTQRAAMLLAFCITSFTAQAAVEEIPITTQSADARLAFMAGQAALDRGDAQEANDLFRTAVTADPGFTYAWFNLSNVAFSTQEFNDSLTSGGRGAANASEGERMMLEFNKYFLDGNTTAQLELATRLTGKYPQAPRAWMLLAGAQAGLNQFAEQRATLEKLMAAAPGFAPAPFALAASYLFNDPTDFAKAEKYYRRAIDIEPGADQYYWSLGDVYRATNKLEDARRYYKLALQLDPHDSIAPLKLGHVDSFLGNFDEARADYDLGIKAASPANAGFLVAFKAFTHVYAGDTATGVKALEHAVTEIDGMGAPPAQRLNAKIGALTAAAQVAMWTGAYDDAQRILTARSALMRENAQQVGTPAFANLQEIQVVFFDAQLAAWRGDFGTAKKLAKKVAQLSAEQNNPRKMEPYHEVLGLIALRQKNHKQAVSEYRQSNLAALHNKYHLAQALESTGAAEEAKRLYGEVARNNFNTADFAVFRKEALKKAG